MCGGGRLTPPLKFKNTHKTIKHTRTSAQAHKQCSVFCLGQNRCKGILPTHALALIIFPCPIVVYCPLTAQPPSGLSPFPLPVASSVFTMTFMLPHRFLMAPSGPLACPITWRDICIVQSPTCFAPASWLKNIPQVPPRRRLSRRGYTTSRLLWMRHGPGQKPSSRSRYSCSPARPAPP